MNELRVPVVIHIGEHSAKGTIRFEIVIHPVPDNPLAGTVELIPMNELAKFFHKGDKVNIPRLLRLLADELEKQAATNGGTL